MVCAVAQNYNDAISEKVKAALIARVLPQAPQDRVHEQLDRLASYRTVCGKVVSLVQSSSKYGNNEMDCSLAGENSGHKC